MAFEFCPKLYKVGNVANKGLQGEEQNKFAKKIVVGIKPRIAHL